MADAPLPWGTDGAVPVLDTSNRWTTWAKSEIYLGAEATNKWIPKINDYVEDTDYGITYKVTALSDLYIPTLSRVTPLPIANMDSEDLLLAESNETFRCFVDKSVMPHRLQVDAACYINARNAVSARVYRGNPINGPQEIVSLVLDQSGLSIGTLIPLELATMPNGINKAQYYIPTAYTTTDIADGDFLYVTLFDDTGAVLSSKGLLAIVTSFTASTDRSIAAVTSIALESPMMSQTVPDQLEVPLNVTLDSLSLTGVVNYNSGAPVRMNVDGTRFQLLGMDLYTPSQAGQLSKMNLKYNLVSGEVSYTGGAVGASRFITRPITILTTDVENQLSVKLYPYPEWQASTSTYKLRWFLLNLDRNIMYDVTPEVELGSNSPALDPTLYGVKQNMTFAIDLSTVNSNWRAFRHVQDVSVTLRKAGAEFDGASTLWTIAFDPGQDPEYGTMNVIKSHMVNQNYDEIDIQSGYGSLDEWLQNLYYNTSPLTNPQLEDAPPVPDHVILTDGTTANSFRVKISDYWNQRFVVPFPVLQDTTWYLQFVQQGASSDLVLGVAGVPVLQVTAWGT